MFVVVWRENGGGREVGKREVGEVVRRARMEAESGVAKRVGMSEMVGKRKGEGRGEKRGRMEQKVEKGERGSFAQKNKVLVAHHK